MAEIAQAVHLVSESDETDLSIVESELNPYWIKCEVCKTWCHLNLCSHVLTATNVKMQRLPQAEHIACVNVVKLLERVDQNRGVDALIGAASTARVRGKKAKALVPDSGGKKGVYTSARSKKEAAQKKTRKAKRMSRKQIEKGILLGQQQQAKKKIRDLAKNSSPSAKRRTASTARVLQCNII